ncbi:MAG: hypothetical protein R3Y35_09535 [Clostridia bacterium]
MTVYIRGIEMPGSVKGVTVEDINGDYNVYVNTVLCPEARDRTYRHELKHIELNHFHDYNPVIINELEASV